MNRNHFQVHLLWLLLFWSGGSLQAYTHAQTPMTIEQALDIAEKNNPDLQAAKLNLERYQYNLVAQQASLKSRFSLDLNPINYSRSRRFDNRLSQWYTNETLNTSGTFMVSQPILLTDGEISLINTFGCRITSR